MTDRFHFSNSLFRAKRLISTLMVGGWALTTHSFSRPPHIRNCGGAEAEGPAHVRCFFVGPTILGPCFLGKRGSSAQVYAFSWIVVDVGPLPGGFRLS